MRKRSAKCPKDLEDSEKWEAVSTRLRQANFDLSLTVTLYETCLSVQGTSAGESFEARVEHNTTQQKLRVDVEALQQNLQAHLQQGCTPPNNGAFFAECYNFTTSVERFAKSLGRSVRKQRHALEKNEHELHLLQATPQLSEEDRLEAVVSCSEVASLVAEKCEASDRLRLDMLSMLQDLRAKAIQAHVREVDVADEPKVVSTTGLVSRKKLVSMIFISLLFCIGLLQIFMQVFLAHRKHFSDSNFDNEYFKQPS